MPSPVFVRRKVLFGDCDPEGIVYTPRFSYFALEAVHDALCIWLDGSGFRRLMEFGILPPARAFSLEFLHPVTWDDELIMEVSVAELREHSYTFSVIGRLEPDIVAFTASITQVCVSPETKKPVKIPDGLRQALG
ncbi:thioesterase [Hahella sp. CCB-MM4]|uniref:acyl-CoA thioesterase n=1 Tax=Hahella sp. (strain CCB-MM4) TaxID=1926491 RepID=UPI000B9B7CCF|nr:thioesterase family protein [Hahella sp. CCB-MM4]OZG72427.1 thioesterase [Hahella sp. CCB-MM4]